jgi:hypothetical protein
MPHSNDPRKRQIPARLEAPVGANGTKRYVDRPSPCGPLAAGKNSPDLIPRPIMPYKGTPKGARMADAKMLALEAETTEINRFHFTVGLIVLTLATLLSSLALRFLILH